MCHIYVTRTVSSVKENTVNQYFLSCTSPSVSLRKTFIKGAPMQYGRNSQPLPSGKKTEWSQIRSVISVITKSWESDLLSIILFHNIAAWPRGCWGRGNETSLKLNNVSAFS